MPLNKDKADDWEVELSSMPKKYPVSPTWDVRQINEMVRPGRGDQSPKARTKRRRDVIQPK